MKLIRLMLIIILASVSVKSFSQVTLSEKNAPLAKVLKSIEAQTGYTFIYDEAKIKLGNVSVELKNAPIDKTLYQCFKTIPVTYKVIEKTIILIARIDSAGTRAQETYAIAGTITDEKGATIPGATVFLNNSKKITATGADGEFYLNHIEPGTYDLVVKTLGYNSYTQSVTVQNQSVEIPIQLKESNIALTQVDIKKKPDPNRVRYLKFFIQNFIGESANAGDCKILNPDVIKLHYDQDRAILEASSDDFIVIKNQALGYQLKYLLKYFEFDIKNRIYAHLGYPYFEELKGSASQQRKWERNRKIAYEGSIRHFFRALFNNTTKDDGFFTYGVTENLTTNKLKIVPVNTDTLSSVIDNDFKLLKLRPARETDADTDRLFVVYTKEQEPTVFYKSDGHIYLPVKLPNKKNQISQIIPNTDGILLDKNGTFTPANKVLFTGYWSWERVADLMPFDYSVNAPKPPQTSSEQNESLPQ